MQGTYTTMTQIEASAYTS